MRRGCAQRRAHALAVFCQWPVPVARAGATTMPAARWSSRQQLVQSSRLLPFEVMYALLVLFALTGAAVVNGARSAAVVGGGGGAGAGAATGRQAHRQQPQARVPDGRATAALWALRGSQSTAAFYPSMFRTWPEFRAYVTAWARPRDARACRVVWEPTGAGTKEDQRVLSIAVRGCHTCLCHENQRKTPF